MRNRLILVVIALVVGIPGAIILVKSGLPDIQYYHLVSAGALVGYAIVGVGILVGSAVFLAGRTVLSIVRGHDQQPLPHSRQVPTKIVAEPAEPKYISRPKPEMLTAKQREMKYRNPVRNPFGNDAKLISQPFQQPVAKEKRTEIS